MAAQQGDLKTIATLLSTGTNVDVNSLNNCGYTPLCIAAHCGQAKAITLLIAEGANRNQPVWLSGETPTFLAAKHGQADAIRALSIAGADMDTRNNNDKTPLHIATQNGHVETVRALLEAGADASMPYLFFWTAIDWAKENKQPGHKQIVQLLETHLKDYPTGVKAKINESSPLLLQAKRGYGSLQDRFTCPV